MQPCVVCGGVTIDNAGHCAHCGTSRGVPGYPQQPTATQPGYSAPGYSPSGYGQPGAAPGYPPMGGPGYPVGGPGYPVGGPGYPTSGPPGGYPPPPAGGGYPGPAHQPGYPVGHPGAPGQPGRSRSLLIPLIALIALGSTLAVLVVAIVVVLAVRGGGGTPSAGVSSPSAGSPAPTPEIPGMDTCVIGVWRVTFHEEEVHNDQLGKLDFTGGEGAKLVLKGDGTGMSDYGSGTEFESTYEGSPIVLEVRGSYTYDFEVEDGQFRVRNLRSEAEARVIVEGDQIGQWIDFRPVGDTASYTCRSDALTQRSLLYTTTFRRID